jgi:hypothetical protein
VMMLVVYMDGSEKWPACASQTQPQSQTHL